MSKLAKKYIDNFLRKYDNMTKFDYDHKQLNSDLVQITGKSLEQLEKRSLFSAWRNIQLYGKYYFTNWVDNKESEMQAFYNEDGSRNEEKILEAIEIRKKEYETEFGLTYEDMISFPETKERHEEKSKNVELSKLFEYMKTDQMWVEVYDCVNGELSIVLRFWSVDAFNAQYFVNMGGRKVYIYEEQLWPDDEEIRAKNKKTVEYVKKEVERQKAEYKDPFDYEQLFEYRIGSPKFIEYHLMKLPKKIRDKYKGKKWKLHTWGFAVSEPTVFESIELIYENCIVDWED